MIRSAIAATGIAVAAATMSAPAAQADPLVVFNFTPTLNVYRVQIVNVKVNQSNANGSAGQANGNVTVNVAQPRNPRHGWR